MFSNGMIWKKKETYRPMHALIEDRTLNMKSGNMKTSIIIENTRNL